MGAGTPVNDACDRPSYDEIVSIQGTNIKRWDVNTQTQAGSSISITGATDAICLIDVDHALVMSTGTATHKEVNLVTSSVTNRTSLDVCPFSAKTQQCAGDISNGVAIGLGFSPEKIMKFTVGTASLLTRRWCINSSAQRNNCIIYKSANRFIVGTEDGRIVEIDQNADMVKMYTLPAPKNIWTSLGRTGTFTLPRSVTTMHYHQGFLTVGLSDGSVWLLSHETEEVMQKWKLYTESSAGVILSPEGGIEVFLGKASSNSSTDEVFCQLDTLRTPGRLSTVAHNSGANACTVSGVSKSGLYPWFATSGIHLFSAGSVRATVNQTHQITDGQGRVTIIDDSGGVGTGNVIFDCPLPSGGQTIPVTNAISRTLNVYQYQDGTHAKFQVLKSST